MPSKAIVSLVDHTISERDLIRMHYRSGGKVKLTDKAVELLERAEQVKALLKENRSDMPLAKKLIKKELNLTHREEVDRAIEDAVYLFGVDVVMQKSYQRFLQLQDIEWGIAIAKQKEDLIAMEKFMARREKLFALDTPDEDEEFEWFSSISIHAEFRPDLFANELPADYKQRSDAILFNAMKELGLIEEAPNVEYTTDSGE